MKYLTRNVKILSFVSLLNDIASEMLYPIMPLFLRSIGFSSVVIGLLEGLANATAGLSKGYFGRISDASGKRRQFVTTGYLLSAISKPMMAIYTFPVWIFFSRSLDRIGKGLRTGARDAILSAECTPENKGKVFGFHKSMDTFGATIGPILALILIGIFPGDYKTIFLLAIIPGILSVLLTLAVKENRQVITTKVSFKLTQAFSYFNSANNNYKHVVVLLLLFGVFNSSDLFLLMKIKESGADDKMVIWCYILYNTVFALAAFPLGHIGDRIGLKKTMIIGLALFVLVYAGFGYAESMPFFLALFVVYGFYAAATEGISKALISNLVPKSETASAIGTYDGMISIAALLASALAGLVWKYISPSAVFYTSAGGTAVVIILFIFQKIKNPAVNNGANN
jgi:MFS family permease